MSSKTGETTRGAGKLLSVVSPVFELIQTASLASRNSKRNSLAGSAGIRARQSVSEHASNSSPSLKRELQRFTFSRSRAQGGLMCPRSRLKLLFLKRGLLEPANVHL